MVDITIGGLRTISALFLSLFFLIECQAKSRQDTRRSKDQSILCYECNSEYDPRCGDPFNNYTIGIVNCSLKEVPEHLEEPKATLCRKTVQIVSGKTRIIRGCGYITSDKDDKECMKKSGTHEVQLKYCSCTGSLCNAGHIDKVPSTILIFFGILLFNMAT